ncbi:class II fructose-bisphosphatase [Salibacterium qingdaonense]|uniref:Fructose-1,6-bisphosphatase n=1 Tax=Salibacterium qingdaonense TaxID=266892 RepID=A0A1I4P1H7_9BACI|nr:class II fructose-bisphosphatase [Salibacterium qingdaonense]SFM21599.1 fructose-1,6-bisphosphatase II [Salibacterium qingdaonense]
MQSLAMSFLNVTQEAAISVFPYIGKGGKILADHKATEAMRGTLHSLNAHSRVVIGEGEMDNAPMLYIGEELGASEDPKVDIAVDPIDGTTLVSKGQGNAIAVLAAAERGCLLHAPDMYMDKIAVGPKAKGRIDVSASIEANVTAVSEALGKSVSQLNVLVQDRERHQSLIQAIQHMGASVTLFSDVDITGIVATAVEGKDVDMLVGTGGAPEGVIAAVAMRSLGGDFQGRLRPADKEQYNRCRDMGIADPDRYLTLDDIVSTDQCFFAATGITDGPLLKGVKSINEEMLQSHTFLAVDRQYHVVESVHVKSQLSGNAL